MKEPILTETMSEVNLGVECFRLPIWAISLVMIVKYMSHVRNKCSSLIGTGNCCRS